MTFTYELNKLMLADGIVFILPGLMNMLIPYKPGLLKEKIEPKKTVSVYKEARIMAGAAYFSIGAIMVGIAGFVSDKGMLNDLAKFRAISLIFILYGLVRQLTGKNLAVKSTQAMYLVLYGILFLGYVFLGFIDPMPA